MIWFSKKTRLESSRSLMNTGGVGVVGFFSSHPETLPNIPPLMKRFLSPLAFLVVALGFPQTSSAYYMPKVAAVFNADTDGLGYANYRLPAAVTATDGSVLIFVEARLPNGGDGAPSDIIMRKGTYNATTNDFTWGSPVTVVTHTTGGLWNHTVHNPCPVVDRRDGKIYLFYCENDPNYPSAESTAGGGYYMKYKVSADGGATWTAPASQATQLAPSAIYAGDTVSVTGAKMGTGPAHGVQMSNTGAYPNRMVIQYRYSAPGSKKCIRIVTSDDGITWTPSAQAIRSTDPNFVLNEVAIVDLLGGSVYFGIRNNPQATVDDETTHFRVWSKTSDFLATTTGFTAPAYVPEMKDPICAGSLLRLYSTERGDTKNQIFAANLDHQTPDVYDGVRFRRFLTIYSSTDEGATWPRKRLVCANYSDATDYSGYSAYSDLVKFSNKAGIFFETGFKVAPPAPFPPRRIDFAWFNPLWITDPTVAAWEFQDKPVGQFAVTNDKFKNAVCIGMTGVMTGTGKYVAGDPLVPSDRALEFGLTTTPGDTSTLDYIKLQESDINGALNIKANESFWINATIRVDPNQHYVGTGPAGAGTIMAKDGGGGQPTWWFRVQDGGLRFQVCDGTKTSAVGITDLLMDGLTHTVSARRDRTVSPPKLRLFIDNVEVASVNDTTTADIAPTQDVYIGNDNGLTHQLKAEISRIEILRNP